MKRAFLGAFVGGALVLALWFALREPAPSPVERSISEATALVPGHDPAAHEEASPPPTPAPEPVEAASREQVRPAPATGTGEVAPPRAHVFGKLVDENDAPIANASVGLSSVDGEWAKGVVIPTIEVRGHRIHGFEMKSDGDGRFDFDLPVPTSDWISLYVEPDEFHALESRHFGPAGGRNHERLKVGDNDLGAFHLASTGAVDGSVHASDGSTIADAEISIHGAYPGGLVISTRSNADGRYTLGHVPEGTWVLAAKRDGFLTAQRSSITVAKRAQTHGADFTLDRAPSIRGVVVDEVGAPVAGVRLWSWPARGGQGAQARSAADGTFEMFLPQNDSYRFDFDHKGYEHYGGHTSAAYEPGTSNVRIVLFKATSIEVQVVDAEGGAPVEQYGIALSMVEHAGWRTEEDLSTPKVEQHPQGRAKVAREHGTVIARVLAPGYASTSMPLTEASGADDTHTIRLTKAASVAGRLLVDGAPPKGASVELSAASLKQDVSQPDEPEEERVFSDNYRPDVTGFAGRTRKLDADADGRFRFDDLAAGHYHLVAHCASTAPFVLESVAVTAKQALDLGAVALHPGAAINGRIAAPTERALGRWHVTLDREWSKERTDVDSSGLFRFDGIAPGKHTLFVRLDQSPGEPHPVLELDLAAGETRDVVLDVASLCPARVTVRVTQGGHPVEGVQVRGQCEGTGQEMQIGTTTDAQGEVRGDCSPCDAVRFEALSALQLPLGASTAPQQVSAGARLDLSLAITSGRARLEFPVGFVVPPRSQAFVILDAAGSRTTRGVVSLGSADLPMPTHTVWKDRVVDLGEMAPGEYEIQANVQQLSDATGAGMMFTPFGPGYRGALVVRPDESATCTLTPREPR